MLFLNDDDCHTHGADVYMLKDNIMGMNNRFIDYNGNGNSLLEGFWLGYSSGGNSAKMTQYILDCIYMSKMDAIDLEFYELAENINTLHNCITDYINNEYKSFNDYTDSIFY